MATDNQKTVLVIDDDRELLDLVSMVLEVEGYHVETALDGEEGLASVEREMPGLILLDMKMPVMNGWGFVENFRARHGHACPILIITASDSARAMAEEVGAAGYIGKPFEVDDLTSAVARHLDADG